VDIIYAALITGAFSLVALLVQRHVERGAMTKLYEQNMAELSERLERAHADRVADLQTQIADLQAQIRSINRKARAHESDTEREPRAD